jgi:small subunit ribosomal protein S18
MAEQDVLSDIGVDADFGGEDGRSGRGRRFRRFGTGRRRKCTPCDDIKFDWKDVAMLQRFQTPQGKLMSRKRTNYCAQCQRELARAVKRARFMALVPYVA